MFKLPTCPYCNTIYRYRDVKNNNKKEIKCYHCKNIIRTSKIKGYIVSGVILTALAVAVNILILNLTADFITSVIPITIISIAAVIMFMILSPYFTDYKKVSGVSEKEIPSKPIAEQNGKMKRSVKARNRKANK